MSSITTFGPHNEGVGLSNTPNAVGIGVTNIIDRDGLDGSIDSFRQRFAHGQGFPKADVADYVEFCGVSVPKRFRTFQSAVDSGMPFMVRSEFPGEYTGRSGVHQSYLVETQSRNIEDWLLFGFMRHIIDDIMGEYADNPNLLVMHLNDLIDLKFQQFFLLPETKKYGEDDCLYHFGKISGNLNEGNQGELWKGLG